MQDLIAGARVLVAEDDPSVSQSIEVALRYAGAEVTLASDGRYAIDEIDAAVEEFDLLVLDVLMPRLDGLDVAIALREVGNRIAILMLTARSDIRDRVAGLDAGADDYLVKPFSIDELLARVAALLRRTPRPDRAAIVVGDLQIDVDKRECSRGGRELQLTRTEFDLLVLLAESPGVERSRDDLFRNIWGDSLDSSSRSLDVYISYLRKKLEEGGEPRIVHTHRGLGFRLDPA